TKDWLTGNCTHQLVCHEFWQPSPNDNQRGVEHRRCNTYRLAELLSGAFYRILLARTLSNGHKAKGPFRWRKQDVDDK
ncbi:hypothetical protein ACC713_38090, partial [Rhizobium johnstonii]|uniref:hypothetical protein n=1 Tax=Rhizobium johnstonii TaxID=3019933 RepID=UPI003F9A7E2C